MMRKRGALATGAGTVVLGLAYLLGAQQIPGDASYGGIGPRVFPTLVGIGLSVAGVAFVAQTWRGSVAAAPPPVRRAPLAWVAGGLALATVLLPWTGFPPAAALLFAMTARGFDLRRWPRTLLIGLILGLVIYIAFSRALGVSLPGGLLERF